MNKICINSKNLQHNLDFVKKQTPRKICAVVKANAYGHGIKQIVSQLSNKVDFFACATLQEAIVIRKYDKNTPILVLFYCGNFDKAIKYNISVSIFNFAQIQKITKKQRELKVHIAFNCGMNRLGFKSIKEIKKAFYLLSSLCTIEGIYTHFPTIANDKKTYHNHIEDFKKIERFAKKYNKNIVSHTGGSLDISNKNFDMIRIGLFLYGYGNKNLLPVMKINSTIIQINILKKNESCGYNNEFIADKNCHIATLPIGYNDGIKKFFLGQLCIFKNKLCPIVAICMDCIMVKVPKYAKVGQEICVFYNADLYKKQLNYETLIGFNSIRGVYITED